MAAFNRLDLFEISNKKQIGNNWYTIFSKTQKKSSFTDKTKKKIGIYIPLIIQAIL